MAAVSEAVTAQRAVKEARTVARYAAAAGAPLRERRRIHDDVVTDHLGVAETIARRYSRDGQDWGDLRQVAYLGLIKAARRFDPERGADFVAFAVPTISGEIKRHLRDHAWFIRPPRRVQELRGTIATTMPRLTQELGRTPSLAELAKSLDDELCNVREAVCSQESLRPASLDSTGSGDDLPLAETIGRIDDQFERAEMMTEIGSACRRLAPRDRRILYLRFFQERTQQEIAAELGVTQMQVSRLLTRILGRLRSDLAYP
ncbi:MAG: sigF [Microbacteriaceae bacterium]|jgi:RNA polymerase sigma-B factor|nr:sigF [Microbacteriaceae bacterium]